MQGLSGDQVEAVLNKLFILGEGGSTNNGVSTILRIVKQGVTQRFADGP